MLTVEHLDLLTKTLTYTPKKAREKGHSIPIQSFLQHRQHGPLVEDDGCEVSPDGHCIWVLVQLSSHWSLVASPLAEAVSGASGARRRSMTVKMNFMFLSMIWLLRLRSASLSCVWWSEAMLFSNWNFPYPFIQNLPRRHWQTIPRYFVPWKRRKSCQEVYLPRGR